MDLDPKSNINDLDPTNMKIVKQLFMEYFYIIHLDLFKEGPIKDLKCKASYEATRVCNILMNKII